MNMPYKNLQSKAARASTKRRHKRYRDKNRDLINKKQRDRIKNDPEYAKRRTEIVKKYQKNNRKKVKHTKRKSYIKKQYGLSWETYKTILKSQNGVCAICEERRNKKRELSVDHDHKTGLVRGLLCDNCNRGIGFFNEDVEKIKKAIKYIKKYEV